MRAHAAAHGRMPPVLHVSFAELMARQHGADARAASRLGMHQGHRVLQLVAEAERAARLIEARARPHAAGEGLIEEPAVGQEVDGRVGRFDIDRAEGPAPVVPDALQGLLGAGGAAEPLNELPRLLFAAGGAEDEDDVLFLSVLKFERDLHRRARIESRADAAGEPHAAHGRGIRRRAVAAEELGAVAGHGAHRSRCCRRRRPGRRIRGCRGCVRRARR